MKTVRKALFTMGEALKICLSLSYVQFNVVTFFQADTSTLCQG